jgi:hypothetical protein
MRSRRVLRTVLVLANLIAAVLSLAAIVVLALFHERPPPPVVRAVALPEADGADFADFHARLRALDVAAPPERPTWEEDFAILRAAPRNFTSRFRVVFASLDEEPSARRCILQWRDSSEQIVLVPGDRVGCLLLLAIDADSSAPRAVRLRFRDTVRGDDVTAVLRPNL